MTAASADNDIEAGHNDTDSLLSHNGGGRGGGNVHNVVGGLVSSSSVTAYGSTAATATTSSSADDGCAAENGGGREEWEVDGHNHHGNGLAVSTAKSPRSLDGTGSLHVNYPESITSSRSYGHDDNNSGIVIGGYQFPSLRRIALEMSLYVNLFITLTKLVAYVRTLSLSVLAALLDSVLDVVSQMVLNYTEKHSTMQRSSAFYPAGASRLEPIGVLTCAALMGMASFEVLKESFTTLLYHDSTFLNTLGLSSGDDDIEGADGGGLHHVLLSFWSMVAIVITKMLLLWLCNTAAYKKVTFPSSTTSTTGTMQFFEEEENQQSSYHPAKAVVQLADPTLEALAQDHWNDCLSNSVAAVALLCALQSPSLWFLDPLGAIVISLYIIYSWYLTGREQIEHLTGKAAPTEFIDEIHVIAANFDAKMQVDSIKAYHFGPKFLVEIEMVMPRDTLLHESHDLGMELQYEIEALSDVERCFVHIDYEQRPYDEHVVSKVPELLMKYRPGIKNNVNNNPGSVANSIGAVSSIR